MTLRVARSCGLALLLACGVSSAVQAEVIDRVLAVAAGRIILLSDVAAARELGLEPGANGADPVRAMLSRLIDRELMLAEVERYAPPEPPPDAIERELAAIRSRFASADDFQRALARSGVDEKHVRENLRQTLRMRAYLDQRFSLSDPRRQALIDEWLAGLRRRGNVVDLYNP